MMQKRLLEKEEYSAAADMIHKAVREESDGLSEQGASGVLSFLSERLASFPAAGIFDPDLKCVLVYEEEPCHILFLAVDSQSRHKGYGKALVQYFIDRMEQKRYASVTVNALIDSAGFYEKLGFEKTGDRQETEGFAYQPMEYLLGRSLLGKTAVVVIDHPCGSLHPFIPDEVYPVNAGYIDEGNSADGAFMEAYVIGTDEPLDTFRGWVAGILYRRNGSAHAIVVPFGRKVSREEIINAVAFEEQYYETRLIMAS